MFGLTFIHGVFGLDRVPHSLTYGYERRLKGIACLMCKVKHGMCPQSIRDLFSVNSAGYNFRGADFHIPRFHSVTFTEKL